MTVELAWRNLVHSRSRMAIAISGIGFAIILLFTQLGLYGAILTTATMAFEPLRFDVILISPDYVDMVQPRTLPRSALSLAATHPDVERATPFYVDAGYWR